MPPRRTAGGGRGRGARAAGAPRSAPSDRQKAQRREDEDAAATLPREETMVKDLLRSMVRQGKEGR